MSEHVEIPQKPVKPENRREGRPPTVCGKCGETGGRFRFLGDGKYVHTPNCDRAQTVRDGARSTFPFTTTHLTGDGQPIEVQNMRHLRRLEERHGAYSAAYNYDSSNL